MAAYSVKARWLLNEASSGTTPTECADDEGTSDLTIDYGTTDANWTSNDDGNGLDFLDVDGTAIADLGDLSGAGTIGGLLEGTQECSIIMVARIDVGDSDQHRAFVIGSDSGNGEIAITFGTASIQLRWARESTGSASTNTYDFTIDGSEHVFQFVCDSTDAGTANRCRFTLDGSLQTATAATIVQHSDLETQDANFSCSIGNRPDATREVNMAMWYFEIGTGLLSAQQLLDSRTALLLDTDVDWQAAPPAGDTGAAMMMGSNF